MKENWSRIEELFHAALELEPAARDEFLSRECDGDQKLRSEVEELLDGFESESDFLSNPAFDVGLEALERTRERSLIGRILGPYEIVEKIGEGGMGEVYRAVDTRLDRVVALKFLSDTLENDGRARRQLAKEARAAAALDHPNICAVYGIEEFDGQHFIVMQHIAGRTLSEILKERRLDEDEFRLLAAQIIEAVAFAHSHGIIHRDLKPGNIMISDDGRAKILDFGLAKAVTPNPLLDHGGDTSQFSNNGALIGTVSYMSPEQLRGEKLDFRSDIFSLGIVLHEMLTGKNPFARPTQAETIAAILDANKTNRPFEAHHNHSVMTVIDRCVAVTQADRYNSAIELSLAITTRDTSPTKHKFRRVSWLIFFLAMGLFGALVVAGILQYGRSEELSKRSISILPFAFEAGDPDLESIADGLTKSLIDELSGLTDLSVRDEYVVRRYRGPNTNASQAGRELGTDAVLTGFIYRQNGKPKLTVSLIRSSDGARIDEFVDYDIENTGMIELQKALAFAVIGRLRTTLTAEDQKRLAKRETDSERAKQLYMEGRYRLKRRQDRAELQLAIDAFTEAKDIDQNYAKAWAGLADAYLALSAPGVKNAKTPKEAVELATLAANQAIKLDNRLSEAFSSLGLIELRYKWNWNESERLFRSAIDLSPEYVPARIGLINVLKLQHRYDEALEQTAKIFEIDPFSVDADLETAKIYYRQREFEKSEAALQKLLARAPNDQAVKNVWTYQLLATSRFSEAIELLETKFRTSPDETKVFVAAPLGYAYARTARRKDALQVIDYLEKAREKFYVPAQEDALIFFGLGNLDRTFASLQRSCDEKFSSLPFWLDDPVVDEIRVDSRIHEIGNCANLPGSP